MCGGGSAPPKKAIYSLWAAPYLEGHSPGTFKSLFTEGHRPSAHQVAKPQPSAEPTATKLTQPSEEAGRRRQSRQRSGGRTVRVALLRDPDF